MADTLIVPFSEELKKKLRSEMNTRADDIAGGLCASYEEYKYQCGIIWGLALAERELIDLTTAATKGDD